MEAVCKLENPIRIKITGKCNRKCFFCHKEGGMDIDTLSYTDELKRSIELLSEKLGMHAIAITGGEPLLYNEFEKLMKKLVSCKGIERFSITTNGTIFKPKKFWLLLKELGLYKVNISMPDILNITGEDKIELLEKTTQNSIFSKQLQTIRILNELGIEVKVNVAVINDLMYTNSVVERLLRIQKLKFDIVLLPNITNLKTFIYSEEIIKELCRVMDLRLLEVRSRKNTSDSIMEYENDLGKKIYIKTTKLLGKPYMLHSLCDKCDIRELCQEGFYGLRLEQVNKKYYIRMCIHKSTSDVLYAIDDFFSSDIFQELSQKWS